MSNNDILAAAIRQELRRYGKNLETLKDGTPESLACIRAIRRRTINSITAQQLTGWLNVSLHVIYEAMGEKKTA